jgi:signal transduction histidine kinase
VASAPGRDDLEAPRRGARDVRAPIRPGRSEWWRVWLFFGSSVLVLAVFVFTNQVVQRLSDEVTTTSRVLARFLAEASFPATRDPGLQEIFAQVIANIDFPIIITDNDSIPRAWRQVGVDPALVPAASIDSLQLGLPGTPVIRARIEQVRRRVAALDRQNRPIEMTQSGSGTRLGFVHYGDPPVLDLLRWMPYVSVGGLLLLLMLGLWGLSGIRQAERRSIWVGMARETAHQLGTPLSSMMGWVELLRSHGEGVPEGAPVPIPKAELDETLDELERDIDRLNKVAHRFSHVGSAPVLQPRDVTPMVRQAVQYARRRLPRGDGEVSLRERYEEVPPVNLNAELLEWAVENLLSNAVSALDKRPGVIEVTVQKRRETEAVEITVSDNGRGMTPAEQRRIFEPGYTTKRRGWGLGLALARRVVEEYHGGRIFVRESAPGQGTTMVISFPT